LAGQQDEYLRRQLKAYRSGERQDPVMGVVAKMLTDEDIANVSAWYASIKITVTEPEWNTGGGDSFTRTGRPRWDSPFLSQLPFKWNS
jgi:cytochrome c553